MSALFKAMFTGILLGITTAGAFSQGMMRGQSTTLPWHSDAETAFAEAAKTQRPVLAVFR